LEYRYIVELDLKADEVVPHIISKNIRRRHLTKQQQADLIVAAYKASRQVGEVPKRHVKGKVGSKKDVIKAKAVDAAKKHGIGKRTVERSFAKAEGTEPKAETTEERNKRISEKRKKTMKANRKARGEAFAEEHPEFAKALGIPVSDQSLWQRLAKIIVRLGSEHEGERQAAADAANKILLPIGWRLVEVSRASLH
jgi:hypothetical protein